MPPQNVCPPPLYSGLSTGVNFYVWTYDAVMVTGKVSAYDQILDHKFSCMEMEAVGFCSVRTRHLVEK